MISWALKRNGESVRNPPGPGMLSTLDTRLVAYYTYMQFPPTDLSLPDDTLLEQPDTPAPIFAVRALKTALFGTPAPKADRTAEKGKGKSSQLASTTTLDLKSPTKPAGILLTPGTGTSRRKRVSFNQDVKEGDPENPSASGIPDEFPGKFPSPWVGKTGEDKNSRPKTRLTEAMENARNKGGLPKDAEPDEWEEYEDDDYEPDPDVTVDLNEPHSRSGKYWKSYFETYHEDAKMEMEKLVKYKQLAKSYAQKKDAEAVDLNQKLKEEQEKVKRMEQNVTELARQVTSSAKRTTRSGHDSKLIDELAKQTALTLQYKAQVQELEEAVREGNLADDEINLIDLKTSPRTHKTLLETQRELRRARSQVRELGRLKDERNRLKSEAKFAEQRANKLAEENKKLVAEFTHQAQSTATKDLEKQLDEAKAEGRRKDLELEKLKMDYETLKTNAKSRYREAEVVVKRRDETIAKLKEEIESLRKSQRGTRVPTTTTTTTTTSKLLDLPSYGEKPSQAPRAPEIPGDNTTLLVQKQLDKLRQDSIEKGLISPLPSAEPVRGKHQVAHRRSATYGALGAAYSGQYDCNAQPKIAMKPLSGGNDLVYPQEAKRHSSGHNGPVDVPDSLGKLSRLSARINASSSTLTSRSTSDNLRLKSSDPPAPSRPRPVSLPMSLQDETPKADLVQHNFARLGAHGGDVNSSAMWNINASKTTLPENRRAAAIARLERKRAERMKDQPSDRNKENQRPGMV